MEFKMKIKASLMTTLHCLFENLSLKFQDHQETETEEGY